MPYPNRELSGTGSAFHFLLTLRKVVADDGGGYPRIIERAGEAPPQYPEHEADAA